MPATPASEPRRGPRYSVWTLVAPVALLVCVSLVVLIARGAGWVGGEETTAGTATRTGTKASTRTGSGRTGTTPARTTTGSETPAGTRTIWRVQPGDTFAAIARRFDVTIEDLVRLNPQTDPRALRVGQRIRVR